MKLLIVLKLCLVFFVFFEYVILVFYLVFVMFSFECDVSWVVVGVILIVELLDSRKVLWWGFLD